MDGRCFLEKPNVRTVKVVVIPLLNPAVRHPRSLDRIRVSIIDVSHFLGVGVLVTCYSLTE